MIKKLNINFLTYSAKSIRAFITEALPMLSPGEVSNHIKTQVYTSNFDVEPRPKYTGFEKVVREDVKTRKRLRHHLKSNHLDDNTEVAEAKSQDIKKYIDDTSQGITFRESLIEIAKTYSDPDNINLVYYSGGLDSEIVIQSFRLAGVDFCPIVFTLTWGSDVINDHDLEWAHKFLSEHSIPYISRTLDISEFWESEVIEAYARDWGISSPQILTQYLMIDTIHSEIEHIGEEKFLSTRITR